MKVYKRKVSKRTDRKVAQYGRNAAAMLGLAKRKARHWTVYTAAVASGFTMATTAEASLLVGIPSPGTDVEENNFTTLGNAAGTAKFARITVSSSSVVFSVLGGAGRGFLGTNSALETFGASDQVSLQDPAVGAVTFTASTNNLPSAGIIGFRTANTNLAVVTGLIDFIIDFSALTTTGATTTTVTINNFWYDTDASDADGTAQIPLPNPTGPPVSVVPVPKAVSLGLLAFGAAGIRAMRRRRQELATS